eukprot:108756-Prorocentrum_minimum.AAC.1
MIGGGGFIIGGLSLKGPERFRSQALHGGAPVRNLTGGPTDQAPHVREGKGGGRRRARAGGRSRARRSGG